MYDKLYKKTSDLADQIISGSYERPRASSSPSERRGGLVPRQARETQEPEYKPYDPSEDLMAQYFVAIRQQNQELMNSLQSDGEGSGEGGWGTGRVSPATPVVGDVGRAREALSVVESSGRYDAVGPVVKSGNYKGDRAYGRYQVMGKNIGPWTEEILGRRYSIDEFMADPEAQDAVVEHRLQQNYRKYGTWEDAASVWFTGRPISENQNDSDGYMTADSYVHKFRSAMRAV